MVINGIPTEEIANVAIEYDYIMSKLTEKLDIEYTIEPDYMNNNITITYDGKFSTGSKEYTTFNLN